MKNQYVGDVNDYCKYGLIRSLTSAGQTASTVAWMLTPDDFSGDGRKLDYLGAPGLWRQGDSELFDALAGLVSAGNLRSVASVAAAGLLPGARFHDEIVPRDIRQRKAHLQHLLDLAEGTELVFFDPDNGFEVGSCPAGSRSSEKYLLWTELAATYHAEHSVLIYQHFPRESRDTFIARIANRITATTGAPEVFAFRTTHVVFLLVPQPGAMQYYADRAREVSVGWDGAIDVSRFAIA